MTLRATASRRFVVILTGALVAGVIGHHEGRPGLAQEPAPPGEGANHSARTVAEVRGLVAELELQAERQRDQLQATEASLSRTRALLWELEGGGAGARPGVQPRLHSPEEERKLPDQAAAETTEWRWADERANPQACARRLGDGYGVQITPAPGKPWASTITVTHGGRALYSWEGHEFSVFARAGDALYYADFHPRKSGCAVVAYDLKDRKLLWKAHLWGYPVFGHSQYRNRVALEVDGKNLVVYGKESYGSYLELVNRETGKTVGHRIVESLVR